MSNAVPDTTPLDLAQQQNLARVKRVMMIASVTTFLAVAAVLGLIGYRVFHLGGSAPPAFADVTAALPAGAKVLSTAVGDGRIVVTIEIAGSIELRIFDLNTLKALGQVRLNPSP